MEIKLMIIINFHASSIIKSIATILKKIIYVKRNKEKNKRTDHNENDLFKKMKTMIITNTKKNNKNQNK
jgi:hypothetical protein